jgi:hypothetical protein
MCLRNETVDNVSLRKKLISDTLDVSKSCNQEFAGCLRPGCKT